MKVVVAPDKFKGCMEASEVADCIEKGIKRVDPEIEVIKIPMADGGEGTVKALVNSCHGRVIYAKARDPLMRVIQSYFGVLNDGSTAIIEMAAIAGLVLLKEDEHNPMKTTTYGLGELIRHALELGCKEIYIGIGGSATNDGGAGMLQALGARLLDAAGNEIGFGAEALAKLEKIDVSQLDYRLKETKILVACDVDNPLCGRNGASYVYGPQKGADMDMVQKLDQYLLNMGSIIERETGINVIDMPGAGAAGGVGISLKAFMGAELKKGIEMVSDITRLNEKLSDADLVITGEGKLDYQTVFGKTPFGVAQAAKRYELPVIALAGTLGEGAGSLESNGFDVILSIVDGPMSLEDAVKNGPRLLEEAAARIIKLLTF